MTQTILKRAWDRQWQTSEDPTRKWCLPPSSFKSRAFTTSFTSFSSLQALKKGRRAGLVSYDSSLQYSISTYQPRMEIYSGRPYKSIDLLSNPHSLLSSLFVQVRTIVLLSTLIKHARCNAITFFQAICLFMPVLRLLYCDSLQFDRIISSSFWCMRTLSITCVLNPPYSVAVPSNSLTTLHRCWNQHN